MKRFARALAVTFGIVVLGSFVFLVPQRNATAQGGPSVTIVNPLPLPVTGNVSVSNFPGTLTGPTVPVSGKVTANVSLPNPLPVNAAVSNAAGASGPVPLVIRDSENPARTAFDVLTRCFFAGSDRCAPIAPIFTVPAGQVAVIESESGSCDTVPGVNVEVAEISFNGSSGDSAFFFTPGPAVLEAVRTVTPFVQNLRAYAFGGANGSPINFVANFTGPSTGNCAIAISGHVVTP